jgi:hypothetical protein
LPASSRKVQKKKPSAPAATASPRNLRIRRNKRIQIAKSTSGSSEFARNCRTSCNEPDTVMPAVSALPEAAWIVDHQPGSETEYRAL